MGCWELQRIKGMMHIVAKEHQCQQVRFNGPWIRQGRVQVALIEWGAS